MAIHPSVAAKLLARAAAIDNRTISESAARAWAESLADHVTTEDGLAAIAAHYGDSRDWIMPADINRRVKAIRSARVAGVTAPAPPIPLGVDQDIAWRRAYIAARADALDDQAARDAANRAHGITPPDPAQEIPAPTAKLRALTAKAAGGAS